MKWTLKLVAEVVPGTPIEYEIAVFERPDLSSPASIGLTIGEGKAILASVQKQVITEQIQQHGASIQLCCRCGKELRTKGYYKSTLRSVYGNVDVRVRRVMGCSCTGSQAHSFSTLFTHYEFLALINAIRAGRARAQDSRTRTDKEAPIDQFQTVISNC